MQLRTIKPISLKETLEQVRSMPLFTHPLAFMWQKSLSISNPFCEAVVHAGYLSYEQMFSASCRYCIGTSKLGGVIFWQIDHEGRVHDGKVMYYLPDCHRNKNVHPTWVSAILAKRREAAMARTRNHKPYTMNRQSSHCLFGLHLVREDVRGREKDNSQFSIINSQFSNGACALNSQLSPPVAIVEAEKSAFILSELFPEYIWLATGGLGEVQPEKFRPLQGHKVVMFPDTDSKGIAFKRWSKAAKEVMRSVFWEDSPPIRVSPILELNATAEQKQRKIDLLDYYFEQHENNE